jgi:hypothetical protein
LQLQSSAAMAATVALTLKSSTAGFIIWLSVSWSTFAVRATIDVASTSPKDMTASAIGF